MQPTGERDLNSIYDYVAQSASEAVALNYVERILDQCDALESAPMRGAPREDIGPGHRTIGFEKRVTILFAVDEDIAHVEILGVFYGGREVVAAD